MKKIMWIFVDMGNPDVRLCVTADPSVMEDEIHSMVPGVNWNFFRLSDKYEVMK